MFRSFPALWFRVAADGTFRDAFAGEGTTPLSPPGEIIDRKIDDVLPPAIAEPAMRHLARALETGAVEQFDYDFVADGERRWFEARMARAADDEVVITVTDVTRRVEAERALRAALVQAEEAVRVRQLFIATITHEVRTPINGILGMAELLLDTTLDAEQRSYVDMLRTSGRSLLGLVTNVLDYSKLDSAPPVLEQVAFSPRQQVENAVHLFADRAHAKGLEIAAIVDHDVPRTAVGDPHRLGQVVSNLLANAVKFTPQGEVSVRVGVAETGPDTATLRWEVRDTGIGIAPEAVPRLFAPFVQADASTTRRFGGTGLGLAICAKAIEQLGGEYGVESTPGQGTTFWFTTTVVLPGGPRRRVESRTSELREAASACRALVVARSPRLREWLGHELRHVGVTVVEASRAEAAIAAASGDEAPFDLLFVQLEGRGAADATGWLRRGLALIGGGAPPAVVGLQRLGDGHARARRAVLDEIDAVLRVPARQQELHEAVGALLQRCQEAAPEAE